MAKDTNLCSATIDVTQLDTMQKQILVKPSQIMTRMENDALVSSVLVGQADFNFLGTTKIQLGVAYLCNFFMEYIILPYIQNRKPPIRLKIRGDNSKNQ